MATTVNLRKILDRKQFEFCSPAPVATAAGMHIASSRLYRQMQYYLTSAALAYKYLPEEDGWEELPAVGLGGTFAAGACSICSANSVGYVSNPTQVGAPLTAFSSAVGTLTTLVTNNNYGVNALGGYLVRCVSGTTANIGSVRTILSNTATTITWASNFPAVPAVGDQFSLEPITQIVNSAASGNTAITVSTINGVAIATLGGNLATTQVPFLTWQLRCITAAAASAANQGVARTISASTGTTITVNTPFPAANFTSGDAFVIEPYATISASTAGSTTTVVTAVANTWPINCFSGYQLRCLTTANATSAGNLGMVRLILSNTATTITLQTLPALAGVTQLGDTFMIEPAVMAQELTYTGTAMTSGSINALTNATGTLVVTGNNWPVNGLVGAQVKAVSGTAANIGTVRTVTSNTATTLTTAAWPGTVTTPDVLEMGVLSVGGYALSITTNAIGSTTTVVTGNTWTVGAYVGFQVRALTGTAANIGIVRTVTSNTATTLTTTAFPSATASSDTFELSIAIPYSAGVAATSIGLTTTVITTNTTWPINYYAGLQIKCTSGTAANLGAIRTISSNTVNTLTVSAFPSATAVSDTFEIGTPAPWLAGQWANSYQVRVTAGTNIGTIRQIVNNSPSTLILAQPLPPSDSTTMFVIEPTVAYSATTSIATNQTFARDLRGFKVRVQSTENIWDERTIQANTFGQNSVLTVTSPFSTTVPSTPYYGASSTATVAIAAASAGGATTTFITTNSWTTDQWKGYQLRTINGTPANLGLSRTILSNTATTLTLSLALPSVTAIGDMIEIDSVQGTVVTATSGSTSTVVVSGATWTVNQYSGYQVRALSGTAGNIGVVRLVASNTATTLTLASVFPSAVATPDVLVLEPVSSMLTAGAYQLQCTRWYIFNAHSASQLANQFRYYDYAYNNFYSTAGFAAAAVQGVPPIGAAWGTDGRLVATPSIVDATNQVFATGTTTSATASTLVNSAKTWGVNQWANAYQVRITAGTGVGQVRNILGNTVNSLQVGAWTSIPDATSVYAIEGCDDSLYLMGNNAVATYRYSVGSGAWNLLQPWVPRAAVPNAGVSGHWAWSTSEPTWAAEANIVSGRRIYSFRGNASTAVDYYDIALNSWVFPTNSQVAVTVTTGTKWAIVSGRYIFFQKDATNRYYRFDTVTGITDPLGQFLYPQGAAAIGDTCFDASYTDSTTTVTWLYLILNTSQVMLRMLLV